MDRQRVIDLISEAAAVGLLLAAAIGAGIIWFVGAVIKGCLDLIRHGLGGCSALSDQVHYEDGGLRYFQCRLCRKRHEIASFSTSRTPHNKASK